MFVIQAPIVIWFQETIGQIFPNEYHLAAQSSVGLDKSYIVHLDMKGDSNLVVGLSNNSVSVYDHETLTKKSTFKAHSQKLTGNENSKTDKN